MEIAGELARAAVVPDASPHVRADPDVSARLSADPADGERQRRRKREPGDVHREAVRLGAELLLQLRDVLRRGVEAVRGAEDLDVGFVRDVARVEPPERHVDIADDPERRLPDVAPLELQPPRVRERGRWRLGAGPRDRVGRAMTPIDREPHAPEGSERRAGEGEGAGGGRPERRVVVERARGRLKVGHEQVTRGLAIDDHARDAPPRALETEDARELRPPRRHAPRCRAGGARE